MKKNTGSLLISLLFAGSAMCAQLAFAAPVDISSAASAIALSPTGSLAFGDKFKNNQKDNFFGDQFTFNIGAVSDLDILLTSKSTSAGNGLNLTGLGLYNSAGLVKGGAQALTGVEDKWTLSYDNLAAGSYYLKVSGNVVSAAGGAFAANGSITSAVPEPESYAMLLAGLGLVGFMARRRKPAVAAA